MSTNIIPNHGESSQPRPNHPHIIMPLQKAAEKAAPFGGGIAANELVSRYKFKQKEARIAKVEKATDKLLSNSENIRAQRKMLEMQVYSEQITPEEKAAGDERCNVLEKYETKHFLQNAAHYGLSSEEAIEVLNDAKMLKPDQTVVVSGHNTLFIYNREMRLVKKGQSENKQQSVGVEETKNKEESTGVEGRSVEGSSPTSLASVSVSQNNLCKTVFASSGPTQQSSSPPEIIYTASYPPRLNFFSLTLIGGSFCFVLWKTFVNQNLENVKNNNSKLSETKSFTQDMVAMPKLQDGMAIIEKFNDQKLTYNQSRTLLIKLDLFDILEIEDLLGKEKIKKDQEQIPGDN